MKENKWRGKRERIKEKTRSEREEEQNTVRNTKKKSESYGVCMSVFFPLQAHQIQCKSGYRNTNAALV